MARSSSSGLFPKEAFFPLHPGLHLTLTNAMQYMKVAPSSGIYPIVYSSKQEHNISYQSSGPDFSKLANSLLSPSSLSSLLSWLSWSSSLWSTGSGFSKLAISRLSCSLSPAFVCQSQSQVLQGILHFYLYEGLSSNPLLRIFAAISFSQVITVCCTSLARIDTKATTTNFSDNKLQRNLTGISSNKSWKWKDRTRFIITVIANSLPEGSKWCFSTDFSFISTEW